MRKIPYAVAALALLAGCPSISTMGTARTLPEDEFQFHLSTGAMVLQDWETDQDTRAAESVSLPALEFGARYGVSERVEVGAKIWGLGLEVNSKLQLHRSQSPERGVDLAVSPALSYFAVEDLSVVWAHVSMPIGFNVPGGRQLVISPRVSDTMIFVGDESGNVLWGGGSVGFAQPFGRSGRFVLMPEFAILVPLRANVGRDVTDEVAFEGALLEFELGFLFGPPARR